MAAPLSPVFCEQVREGMKSRNITMNNDVCKCVHVYFCVRSAYLCDFECENCGIAWDCERACTCIQALNKKGLLLVRVTYMP
jgi:hypothetical protein